MIRRFLHKPDIRSWTTHNRRNAKIAIMTMAGLIIVWIIPLFALYLNDTMAAYWLGTTLALAWREWVQNEIDNRRREQDKASHESLQRWYKRKHG